MGVPYFMCIKHNLGGPLIKHNQGGPLLYVYQAQPWGSLNQAQPYGGPLLYVYQAQDTVIQTPESVFQLLLEAIIDKDISFVGAHQHETRVHCYHTEDKGAFLHHHTLYEMDNTWRQSVRKTYITVNK